MSLQHRELVLDVKALDIFVSLHSHIVGTWKKLSSVSNVLLSNNLDS